MLDNLLLKLGFKGHDGKARPGNLDASGNLKVKVEDTDPVKVQVSGTNVVRRRVVISSIPGGQVQTNIITPDSSSRLIGVFSNIRTEGSPTTGRLQMDVYVGDDGLSFMNRIIRAIGDNLISLRKILTLYPTGIEQGTKIMLPSGIENINDYLTHCSKFSFSPNKPLVVEISNTTDQPVSNPQLKLLEVWYTSF